MKKIVSFLLISCMIVGFTGCSASKPTAVVESYCDALKAYDLQTASSYMENASTNPDTETEVEESFTDEQMLAFLKECASEMKYVIKETNIDGEEAEVSVEFEYVDASPVMQATIGEYFSQALALAFGGADDDALENLLGTIFSEKASEVETGTSTVTVIFNCVKQDGEWKISEFSEEEENKLNNIMTSNILKVFEEMESESGTSSSDSEDGNDENVVWHDVPAGETVELSTLKMCIKECTETDKLTAKYYESDVAQEGTKFVVIEFMVENITKSTISFDNDLMLTDSQGREYSDYSNALWYYDETFSYTELAPNIPLTGHIVYNVPVDSSDYYLSVGKSGTNEVYRLLAN